MKISQPLERSTVNTRILQNCYTLISMRCVDVEYTGSDYDFSFMPKTLPVLGERLTRVVNYMCNGTWCEVIIIAVINISRRDRRKTMKWKMPAVRSDSLFRPVTKLITTRSRTSAQCNCAGYLSISPQYVTFSPLCVRRSLGAARFKMPATCGVCSRTVR